MYPGNKSFNIFNLDLYNSNFLATLKLLFMGLSCLCLLSTLLPLLSQLDYCSSLRSTSFHRLYLSSEMSTCDLLSQLLAGLRSLFQHHLFSQAFLIYKRTSSCVPVHYVPPFLFFFIVFTSIPFLSHFILIFNILCFFFFVI